MPPCRERCIKDCSTECARAASRCRECVNFQLHWARTVNNTFCIDFSTCNFYCLLFDEVLNCFWFMLQHCIIAECQCVNYYFHMAVRELLFSFQSRVSLSSSLYLIAAYLRWQSVALSLGTASRIWAELNEDCYRGIVKWRVFFNYLQELHACCAGRPWNLYVASATGHITARDTKMLIYTRGATSNVDDQLRCIPDSCLSG